LVGNWPHPVVRSDDDSVIGTGHARTGPARVG